MPTLVSERHSLIDTNIVYKTKEPAQCYEAGLVINFPHVDVRFSIPPPGILTWDQEETSFEDICHLVACGPKLAMVPWRRKKSLVSKMLGISNFLSLGPNAMLPQISRK